MSPITSYLLLGLLALAIVKAEVHYTITGKICRTSCKFSDSDCSTCYGDDWFQSLCSVKRNYSIRGLPCQPDHSCAKRDDGQYWCLTTSGNLDGCSPVEEGDPPATPLYVMTHGIFGNKHTFVTEIYDDKCYNVPASAKYMEHAGTRYGCTRLWLNANCQGESLTLNKTTSSYLSKYVAETTSDNTFIYNVKSYSSCDSAEISTVRIGDRGSWKTERRREVQVRPNECKNLGRFAKWASEVWVPEGCARLWEKNDCEGRYLEVIHEEIDLITKKLSGSTTWDKQVSSISPC